MKKNLLSGVETSEFWFGVLVALGIYALIWFGKFPEHGSAGYEGITDILIIWGSYTGYRGFLKQGKQKGEQTNERPSYVAMAGSGQPVP